MSKQWVGQNKPNQGANKSGQFITTPLRPVRCYTCDGFGHIQAVCPNYKPTKTTPQAQVKRVTVSTVPGEARANLELKPSNSEVGEEAVRASAPQPTESNAGPGFAPNSVVGCGDDEGNDGDIAVGELTVFNDLVDPNSSQVGELIAEQSRDKSLTGAFALARDSKGGYFLRDGLLFHRAQILGQDVDRLVVPMGRRSALFDLVHAQICCHSGIRKTK